MRSRTRSSNWRRAHGPEPGDVRGPGRQRVHHFRAGPGAAPGCAGPRVHLPADPVALVHGAVREFRRGDGRRPGKAQADELRKTRRETQAKRLGEPTDTRNVRAVPSQLAQSGDLVVCTPGDLIPGDGEVIEGVASVDESAITGESAPVIRESGGDRSAVTGGTKVLSDQLVIRITADPGRDLPRPDDRAGRGRGASEDAERDRAHDPALRAHAHFPAGRRRPSSRSRPTAGAPWRSRS